MTKRMLIDATHAEETRVVVLDGNRLEDFDVETSTKKQLKGNIYLAKIVRVEPSLQAAFVEYGGGRHGFLAFGEIHPDYYQIPVADRQRLLAMQAQEAREEEEAEDRAALADGASREAGSGGAQEPEVVHADLNADAGPSPDETEPAHEPAGEMSALDETVAEPVVEASVADAPHEPATDEGAAPGSEPEPESHDSAPPRPAQAAMIPQDVRFGEEVFPHGDNIQPGLSDDHVHGGASFDEPPAYEPLADVSADAPASDLAGAEIETADFDSTQPDLPPETIGGENDNSDGADEARERRTARMLRNYRIQEVIRRRQIILVQVVKEERGSKGAALTTYISLAGRFCVLMPNSPRGGGISRKITSAADRRRLKEITTELDVPQGMGLIVRTAGAARPKPEIKRDAEYLMRLWDDIREHTMKSMAPALIYEEASLIKRSIRDVYSRDVDEILVDGEEGWRSAHEFMRMLMPSHAKKVQLWRPNGGSAPQPLFSKFAVEDQLDAMLSPTVQLKSGGYLVINQTEALVAIDVNSGRSTRERGIEETALRTNLEASDEVARQLRLRDLAGLIVIDYIDMEARKHNAAVERRLTEALKNDRARIQVGHISAFGLMEMSRQRLRPSLAETSFVACPHCMGSGLVRSIESSSVHVLRAIEEEGAKAKASLIMVHCANAIAMYLLNNKRERLAGIEALYAMRVHFAADESLTPPHIRIDRLKPPVPEAERVLFAPVLPAAPALVGDDDADEADDEVIDETPEVRVAAASKPAPLRPPAAKPASPAPAAAAATGESEESVRRRRRRRRRGGRREGGEPSLGMEPGTDSAVTMFEGDDGAVVVSEESETPDVVAAEATFMADSHGDDAPTADEISIGDEIEAAVAAAAIAGDEQPAIDPAELDENGMPKARRRGRRGGRRRRRDGVGEEASGETELAAPPLAPMPAYVGPTPADPFGGQTFDIFDMMDEVESRPIATVSPRAHERAAAPAQASLDIAPPSPVAAAIEAAPDLFEPEQAAVEPIGAASHTVEFVTPAVVADEPPVAAPAETEPVAAAPEVVVVTPPEPKPAPVIVPVLVGQEDTPVAEPKKGWWRR